MGQVWFTIKACHYDPNQVPTESGVACAVATITAMFLCPILSLCLYSSVKLTGLPDMLAARKMGVYADGRCLAVRGRDDGNGGDSRWVLELVPVEAEGGKTSLGGKDV